MSRFQIAFCTVMTLTLTVSAARAADEPRSGAPNADESAADAPVDRATLEKNFAENMSGVVFAGSYSVTSGGKETAAQMEKYTISRVVKAKEGEDSWLFTTRIQYANTDLAIPLKLQVKWAGDTPVITLTNLTIPGMGTFTSRVMIYGDRYAGTWQHGKTGGHLWGRIEKTERP